MKSFRDDALPPQPPPISPLALAEPDELPKACATLLGHLADGTWRSVPTHARGYAERKASVNGPHRWVDVESLCLRLRHDQALTGAVLMWHREPPLDGDWSAQGGWIWTLCPSRPPLICAGRVDHPAQTPLALGITAVTAMVRRIDEEYRP